MKLFVAFGFGLVVTFLAFSAAEVRGTCFSGDCHSRSTMSGRLSDTNSTSLILNRRDDQFGIKEVIPDHVRGRYQRWKDELLSTDFGRKQWEHYANRRDFLLTIVVSSSRKYGAGTD